MQSQVLSPGVQNAEEADLGSEVLGVGRNFEHGLGAGAEEQIVEQPWIALTERVQLVGQGKDDVEVGHAEQILFAPCQPASAGVPGLGTWDSGGCDRSYRKWLGGRNVSRRPDGLPAQPCDMR